jgi:DNA-directed RNA polymerase sigma subunit (sigma70/sigma32)
MLVNNILSTLSQKQQDIIKMAFGIGYDRQYSTEEIGDKYEMDEMTINQLKNNIIKYLRENRGEYKLAI